MRLAMDSVRDGPSLCYDTGFHKSGASHSSPVALSRARAIPFDRIGLYVNDHRQRCPGLSEGLAVEADNP